MKIIVALLATLFAAQAAEASCTPAQIRQLIQQGLSDAEIDRRCASQSQLPAWLNGRWTVTKNLSNSGVSGFGYPPTTEVWEIGVRGQGFTLGSVTDPFAHNSNVVDIPVQNIQFDGSNLSFDTRTKGIGTVNTTTYRLSVNAEDHLTGQWNSKDGGSFGLPPLVQSGTVVAVKE